MERNVKDEIIAEIKDLVNSSSAIYLVDYKGVNVEDINKLRKEFIKEGLKYKVFKNTLFKKTLKEVEGFEKFDDLLVGMTGAVFCGDNYIVPAKIIKKYFDEKNKFSLKGCYLDKQFYEGDKLAQIATLPTKEEIIAGVLGSIMSPASGIVGALNAVIRDLVSVIDEISKKEAA